MRNHDLSILAVEREARSIARKTFRGSRSVVHKKSNHIVNVAEAIRVRWSVAPRGWQVKHVRWFLERHTKNLATGTRYRYFRYIRDVLIYQNRWDDFGPRLNGSWAFPKIIPEADSSKAESI